MIRCVSCRAQAFEELVQKILDSPHLASNDVAGHLFLPDGCLNMLL